jgi:hypothetical protein
MKRTTIVAGLLLGGMSLAVAQSDYNPPGANPTVQGKCWDQATQTVKDKATQSASGGRQPGGVTTGAGTSGNAANSTGSRLQTKPASVPNC